MKNHEFFIQRWEADGEDLTHGRLWPRHIIVVEHFQVVAHNILGREVQVQVGALVVPEWETCSEPPRSHQASRRGRQHDCQCLGPHP